MYVYVCMTRPTFILRLDGENKSRNEMLAVGRLQRALQQQPPAGDRQHPGGDCEHGAIPAAGTARKKRPPG